MKSKQIELKDFINNNRRKVKLENLNAKHGFTFEDDKLLAIRRKIEAAGVPLGIDFKVTLGIPTGCNIAFMVDNEKKKSLCEESINAQKFLKPCIRGRDISKYVHNKSEDWVIIIPSGWTNKNSKGGDGEEFFKNYCNSIYNHIKDYGEKIRRGEIKAKADLFDRHSQGDYWWELRDCAYYDMFDTKKVLFSEMQSNNSFYHDSDGVYCTNTVYMCTGNNTEDLTAVLNSRIVWNIFRKFVTYSELGSALRWTKAAVDRLIIPYNFEKMGLDKLTVNIQHLKQQGKPTDHLETEVEKIVQELYGLTDEEVEYLCR